MKVPSSTSEKPVAARSQPVTAPASEPVPRRSEEADYVPRYVALPRHRERGHGRRNLVGGVILLVVAVLFLAWALYLAGPSAVFTVAACLATATLLHVMARSRLFRQRNGAFVAWAGVCLLGVALVLLHHGWVSMTGGGRSGKAAAVGGEAPLLRDSFPTREDPTGATVRILRDTKVTIDNKAYLAKQGELYPLVDVGVDERGNGQLRFAVAGHDVIISKSAAEIAPSESVPGLDSPAGSAAKVPGLPPAGAAATPEPAKPRTFDELYLASSQAAMRRYPGLAKIGSNENRFFRSASTELKLSGEHDFFKDPNWPLMLADECALKEGWVRADGTTPPPVAPAELAPPAAEPEIPRGQPVRRPLPQ